MGDTAWAALISGAFAILALLVAAILNHRTGGRVNGLVDVVDEWKAIAREAKAEAAECQRQFSRFERELERCEARSQQLEAEVSSLAESLQTVLDRFTD